MRLPTLLVLLPALLSALAACDRPPPVREDRPRPVRSVVVEPSRTEITLSLPGEVRPRVETRYGFRIAGKIAERSVSVGDPVRAGQMLARLDPRDLAPAIARARAQLEAARTEATLAQVELERMKDLHSRSFISLAQVDRQQAQSDASQARQRNAEAQLQEARNSAAFQTLVSDTAGIVTAIEAEAGQVVSAGQPVVRVARTDAPELLVNVPESDLVAARGVPRWQVRIAALGDAPLQATIRELSPVADAASRTYPMRLSLLGDTRGVALGMSATAQVVRDSDESIVVPLSALYSQDGRPHVWVVAADLSVQPKPVRTAGLLDDAVRVVDGLRPGDRVVTAGANLLVAGQKVRLLDEAAGRPTHRRDSDPGQAGNDR